ncbi:MAG: PilT/PilU family type 4a pilus ATPase [Verrucomicrobia bacterium]|jgi:twitching motility protein PilT|nr:PilT/PilU family type 4a pilus ATPase [Verrucomicrobiota bacterium]
MELFQQILKAAVDGGASDIHFKVDGPVIFRISSELIAVDSPSPTLEWINKVVERIIPSHLKERLQEERGADFSYFIPEVGRFRTNIFQQRGQWCIAMRHVKTKAPDFSTLGLPSTLAEIAEAPRGIVLVTGATGSGKSTTLAAMIEHINTHAKKHIITMEDPIEFVFEDNQCIIEQREVGLDTLSFHAALKHVLRQDPDVIMVGEMRDATSLNAAISAANTGHLVLSTLHTNNAAQALNRAMEFFNAEEREQVRRQLVGTLHAVICQRMAVTVNGGMTPAVEIMINTPTVRKLIEENRLDKLPAAIETGTDDGMQNFNQALYKLVKEGKITEKEAMAKATNPQALEMNLKGIFLSEGKRILG